MKLPVRLLLPLLLLEIEAAAANPASPVILRSPDTATAAPPAADVTLKESLLFLTAGRLSMFERTTERNEIEKLYDIAIPAPIYQFFEVAPSLVYVAHGRGVAILDISVPAAAKVIRTFSAEDHVVRMSLEGHTLALKLFNDDTVRYNIQDPLAPRFLARQVAVRPANKHRLPRQIAGSVLIIGGIVAGSVGGLWMVFSPLCLVPSEAGYNSSRTPLSTCLGQSLGGGAGLLVGGGLAIRLGFLLGKD